MRDDNKKPSYSLDEMEKWLEYFFRDPFTAYLDQTQFRIDIFDTESHFILEALLPASSASDIKITIEQSSVKIFGQTKAGKERSRTVELPFIVVKKDVTAFFKDAILEIYISKQKLGSGLNRDIPIKESD
ncbi:Hsp20/alpha crystallin family protein [Mesobacillus harenae]|uniref:Hsp20/alpha crystallin family protein n=1 Tax=Mesobacillus harenae TaxID=2213203 RepID=UPI00157FDFAC|nr:Hsp20/alpha crystallin family protein [Mesobacillus harenae]